MTTIGTIAHIDHGKTSVTAALVSLLPPEPDRLYTATAYGMVGTGRTQYEARQDLFEKIRLAGQA